MFNKTLDLATLMLHGLPWLALLAALVLSPGWRYGDNAQAQTTTLGDSGITAVSTGGNHTCRLKSGGVQCWGANGSGQLGNGSTTNSTVPVQVSGLGSGVSSISAGNFYTCAVRTGGGVVCWGYNDYGQLGNGSTTNSTVPVQVSGLGSGVSSISAGTLHTCAVRTGGGVQCWGYNFSGQLGNGSTTNSTVPVKVSGLGSGVRTVDVGGQHTCALMTGGGVQCWGGNFYGQLGIGSDGSDTNSTVPVKVFGLGIGVSAISVGILHTCAVTTGGRVQCWGARGHGQLGNGSGGVNDRTGSHNTPVTVSNDPFVIQLARVAVSAGGRYTCALMTGGSVECWGENVSGQLGNGSTNESLVPVEVSGLSGGVRTVSAFNEHTCALTTGGVVECWGANGSGQLGNGSTTNSNVPVPVR